MGVPNTSVIASGGPARGAVVRSAVLEQFTRLIAGADSATRTLAAWCGEPPTTRIHTREEAATLPEEAVLLVIRPIRASETSAAPGTSLEPQAFRGRRQTADRREHRSAAATDALQQR